MLNYSAIDLLGKHIDPGGNPINLIKGIRDPDPGIRVSGSNFRNGREYAFYSGIFCLHILKPLG